MISGYLQVLGWRDLTWRRRARLIVLNLHPHVVWNRLRYRRSMGAGWWYTVTGWSPPAQKGFRLD